MKRKNIDTDIDNRNVKKPYIRASSVGNYLMNDGLVDYLTRDNQKPISLATLYIMEQGNIFEEELIKLVKKNHKVYEPVFNSYDNETKHNVTIKALEQGHDIIYQGYIYDKSNNIGGSPDLIVKSTYLNRLMNSNIIKNFNIVSTINNKRNKYYYVIVDIKHSTIHLNGIHIKNVNRIPAYKAQLYIYTKILNNLQSIVINKAYIWGKDYSDNSNFLNTLGVIDYDTVDKEFVTKTNNAIKWITTVHNDVMTIVPPSHDELYPNMKSASCIDTKKQLNKDVNDITTLWNCSVNHRKLAKEHNILSWKDDNLSSGKLGFSNDRGTVIDNIISINKQTSDIIRITKPITLNKQEDTINIFIDFEGFSDKMKCKIKNGVILDNNNYYIYMIGIGYIMDNVWTYKSFIMKDTNSQTHLVSSLFYYLRTLLRKMKKTKIAFYHWSHYERTHFNRIKQDIKLCLEDTTYSFIDLCSIFQKHVVIKDCFNFKLKSITTALYCNKMIETCYYKDSDCVDGLDACINALKLYDANEIVVNNPIMKSIEQYNSIDCKMLYELYNLLEKLQM